MKDEPSLSFGRCILCEYVNGHAPDCRSQRKDPELATIDPRRVPPQLRGATSAIREGR